MIGLASVVLFGQAAVAQTVSKRLAVLEFRGKIDNDVLDTFADAVRGGAVEGLAGREIEVLTRENMMVLIREMGKKDCTEGDCEVETARNIGADFVMSGTVARVDDAFVVTLKLHETKRGSLLATNQIDAKTQLEVLRQLRELGRKLVASNIDFRGTPSVAQAQTATVAEPPTPAPPAQSSANLEASPSDVAAFARKGPHFGFEVGAGFLVGNRGDWKGPQGSLGGFLNLGLDPAVDFRVGLRLHYGSLGELNSVVLLGIPASFRFNLGPTYSSVVGATVGVRWTSEAGDPACAGSRCPGPEEGIFLSPEVSLLNFRFGTNERFEVAAVQGMTFPISSTRFRTDWGNSVLDIFYNTFVFSMLW